MLPARSLHSDNRQMWVDGGTIVAGSAAISLWAQHLTLMSVLVPVLIAARFAVWNRWAKRANQSLLHEALFFLCCTVLGAFNDWNSVVHHQIYDYTVPHFFPGFSTIPIWMLLFWGMALRFIATFANWERPQSGTRGDEKLVAGRIRGPVVRMMFMLGLVLVTRQFIYRNFLDPVTSWLPFALAIVVFVAVLGLTRKELGLAISAGLIGPVLEILYIQVGELHRYHLGWLGGVPLWIALWWALIILIWKDISDLLHRALGRVVPTPARNVIEAC